MKRKSQNVKHFKDEIRESFISYALIPTLIVSFVIIVSLLFLWIYSIFSTIKKDNELISTAISSHVDNHMRALENPWGGGVTISEIKLSKDKLSEVYNSLKVNSSKYNLSENFVILDKDYQIILESGSESLFKVPDYQSSLTWGTLGRMTEKAPNITVEISKDYSKTGLAEILVGRGIYSYGELDGFVIFTISQKDILSLCKNVSSPFVVTDSFGYSLISTTPTMLNEFGKLKLELRDSETAMITTKNQLSSKRVLSKGNFQVYTFYNLEQLKVSIIFSAVLMVTILSLLVFGMLKSAKKISEEKSKVISDIVKAYKDVEMGNLENRLYLNASEEFQTIATAYNKMLDDIKALIVANRREMKAKYHSEIKQLEMQFNPHFLFNTLDNVKYMINQRPDEAKEMICDLSEILRYAIDNDKSEVLLKDDITYIRSYLDILKTRFSKRVDFTFDISKNALNCKVPKLIIQPILENSVKYGFDILGTLTLKISAHVKEGNLEIKISDSGVGMSPNDLAKIVKLLKEDTNTTNHIGLFNVKRRINLMYGGDYGLELKSAQGKGTTAKIILPVKTN